jgi:sugar phosphate isomerase/epimerase
MNIGLSTYAFFWQHSPRVAEPMSLEQMVDASIGYGVNRFQICDYPAVESFDDDRLRCLRDRAASGGIALELGTRGVGADHLDRYLDLAKTLDVKVVRSMVRDNGPDLGFAEMESELRAVTKRYRDAGVTVALETYERYPTHMLVALVEAVDAPNLGICLDPANCIAALESPADVIDRCADRTVNLHVKDFRFGRQDGLNGFVLTGAPLGEGQLDLDLLFGRVRPAERGISQIIEHWLPWQGDERTTVDTERSWIAHNITYLRSAA